MWPGLGCDHRLFAGVAKHGSRAVCPPRRGNRKGVVEKNNHTAAQRWWRTLPDDVTPEQAQADLDRFCSARADTRMRATPEGRCTVAAVAETEPLQPVPAAPYPVIVAEERTASRQALVAYRGNRYSVPPELAMATVTGTVNLRSCGRSANHISLIRHTRPGESRRRTGENRPRIAQVDSAAPGQVEVFDVDLEQFFCASAGFVEHSPQRFLPDVDVAAGDELVDRGARVRRVAPVSYC